MNASLAGCALAVLAGGALDPTDYAFAADAVTRLPPPGASIGVGDEVQIPIEAEFTRGAEG